MAFVKELAEMLSCKQNWEVFFRIYDLDFKNYHFVKNTRKEFLWMSNSLRELHGIKGDSYFGKTDYDYSPPDLAFLYQTEDDVVLKSGHPVINQPWIVNDKHGKHKWYISSKFPLSTPRGRVIGLTGMMRNVTDEIEKSPLNEMSVVVEYIFQHYQEKIDINHLASMIYLSMSQFERKFQQLFRMRPGAFILKVRIDASVRLLIESDCSITDVANRCGFFDNSHFTRHFKKSMGMTPIAFRKQYMHIE